MARTPDVLEELSDLHAQHAVARYMLLLIKKLARMKIQLSEFETKIIRDAFAAGVLVGKELDRRE